MMAQMRHPNVVLYLGLCLEPPCVVTEYCARGSLSDVLKQANRMPNFAQQLDWSRRLTMALDAAKGMHYLHRSDPPVIHRDLKSPNLLVDRHWRVKVAPCPAVDATRLRPTPCCITNFAMGYLFIMFCSSQRHGHVGGLDSASARSLDAMQPSLPARYQHCV